MYKLQKRWPQPKATFFILEFFGGDFSMSLMYHKYFLNRQKKFNTKENLRITQKSHCRIYLRSHKNN